MEYLCSECSTQLSDFEIELNELYPVGKLIL
jgi:DNA-directed RNA polymerase subunit RPC12/RpoP